jgi:pimeloyl-ACP methyl ester carboxylesterase
MSVDVRLVRKIKKTSGRRVVVVVAMLMGVVSCGAQPRGPVSEPTPALASSHPCDPAALGATTPDVFRGPGGVTFSCATLSVPLDHAGLRAAPPQSGQLSLQVAMADNTTAPRGVLVWLVGGPGVGLTATAGAERRAPARRRASVRPLTLDGASYGTFLAERYAITHPDRVSRLVLDSVVPHDGLDPLQIAVFGRTADVLQMVCRESRENGCATDPAQDLSEVVRRRHDGPQLLDTLTALTNGKPTLTDIPAALHKAARGDDTQLDAIIATGHQGPATKADTFSQGLFASTACADMLWPWGDADAPVAGRAGATTKAVATLSEAAVFPYDRATAATNRVMVTCEQWPPTPVAAFPSGADLPPVPTLLLAGDHDLDTPLAWAQHEATHAPHGHLVVIPGSGHITQNNANGPAGRAAVTRFLTGPGI